MRRTPDPLRVILSLLDRAGRTRYWLATHRDSPVQPQHAYRILRGSRMLRADVFVAWLYLLGGEVALPKRAAVDGRAR